MIKPAYLTNKTIANYCGGLVIVTENAAATQWYIWTYEEHYHDYAELIGCHDTFSKEDTLAVAKQEAQELRRKVTQ